MARHRRDVVNPIILKKLKIASVVLSAAINGEEVQEEDLVIPKELVEKLLEDYLLEEQFEKCKKVKNFLDSKPSYVKNITAKEWMDDYLTKL